jgi:hypothetical protein
MSSAYHPQTDGQSERTNQTAEIAIRFHLFEHALDHPIPLWRPFLPILQSLLNNSPNAATGHSANEINFGRNNRDSLTVTTATDDPPHTAAILQARQRMQAEAIDTIN